MSLSFRQELIDGNYLIFKFDSDLGTAFKAGDKFIIAHENGYTHTKKIGTLKAVGYVNTTDEILVQNRISLWGAKFRLISDSGDLCLSQNQICYAHLKNTLFDSKTTRQLFRKELAYDAELTKSKYDAILAATIAELGAAQTQTLRAMNGCPTIFPTYKRFRDIGEILFRSVKLLDTIPTSTKQAKFVKALKDGVTFIKEEYTTNFSKTAYYDCNNQSELMTGYLVVRGINEFLKYAPDATLKAYLASILNDINNSDHARSVRQAVALSPNIVVFANMSA